LIENLFQQLPENPPEELFTLLQESSAIRIERIVSRGHASPPDFWYDQDQDEWILLLRGAARLVIESATLNLKPGDFLNIPAHTRHRVDWTTPDEPTLWLAVHHGSKKAG
jgi:cupin 2 domain-containing protein